MGGRGARLPPGSQAQPAGTPPCAGSLPAADAFLTCRSCRGLRSCLLSGRRVQHWALRLRDAGRAEPGGLHSHTHVPCPLRLAPRGLGVFPCCRAPPSSPWGCSQACGPCSPEPSRGPAHLLCSLGRWVSLSLRLSMVCGGPTSRKARRPSPMLTRTVVTTGPPGQVPQAPPTRRPDR